MGRPVDRVSGVVLVTDYGALDAALAKKARMEAKKSEKNWKISKMGSMSPFLMPW